MRDSYFEDQQVTHKYILLFVKTKYLIKALEFESFYHKKKKKSF